MAQANTTTTTVAKASPLADFKSMLSNPSTQAALARAMPKHIKIEKIISAALTAAQMNPDIATCTKASVLRSMLIASMLGLEPGGALGSAYLVPFKDKKSGTVICTLIPGYRGLIDLARRSGAVKGVEARAVYDCDRFDYAYGTEAYIKHIPTLKRPGGAQFIAAYCVITLLDGTKTFDVMSVDDINAIRDRSKAKDDGPWVTDYPEMARKTVTKRTLKYAPISTELAQAVALDDRAEAGEDQGAGIIDIAAEDLETPPTTADAVRARLAPIAADSGPHAAA